MRYRVKMSNEAQVDFDSYIDYILYDCDAPITAAKHFTEINDIISSLAVNPFIYAVRHDDSLLKYGLNVRRANFKKIAILFSVFDDLVFIHKIIASSMITGLN